MSILDLFKTNERIVQSDGPGTGPSATDNRTNQPRIPVPDPAKPNMLGYGGTADTTEAVKMVPRQGPVHGSESMIAAQARMPGISFGGPPTPLLPRYNHLYDTHRTRDGWRFMSDDVVTVTFTPTAGTVVTAVAPTANGGLFKTRQSQYPGGVHLLLCVRSFFFAPEGTTITGALEFRFQGTNGGDTAPLGVFFGNAAGTSTTPHILATPITDAGLPSYGNILCIGQGAGGTFVPVAAQIGFSFVYVTPDAAFKGYNQDTGWQGDKEAYSVK